MESDAEIPSASMGASAVDLAFIDAMWADPQASRATLASLANVVEPCLAGVVLDFVSDGFCVAIHV